ncbi:MAG: carbon-nitrogen hydrolase family protein [Actinomycetota bacterium]|nr:carbon-nitrogen hydrolase family protein [Actinomycetota bacterium]
MRAALFQGPLASGDVATNVAAIADAAARAAASGADILVTPEMSATGYNIGALSARRAEPARGPLFDAIAGICQRHGIAIVYGYPESVEAGNYNSVQAIGPTGDDLGSHRKTHLYGDLDRGLFVPGDRLVSQFRLAGLTVGLAICYDIEFPEVARAHAEAGTDILLVPTGLMAPFEIVANILVPARAYENQLYVAYVNRCDAEADLNYCGLTCAVSPDGTEVARAGPGEELVFADIEAGNLEAGRAINTHLPDRRSDLYGATTTDSIDPARRDPAQNSARSNT